MTSPLLVVSPAHHCDPQLVIASARFGATGLLDLGLAEPNEVRAGALEKAARLVGRQASWGVRWDVFGCTSRTPSRLVKLVDGRWPILLLGGVDFQRQDPRAILRQGKRVAKRVLLEVCSLEEALAAETAGFDGIVVVGHEAGGRVAIESSYILLQRLSGKLRVPFWVRGGMGPLTAAAARLAGAAGVVLGEQLWLTEESPFSPAEREYLGRLDGSHTVCRQDGSVCYRFVAPAGRSIAEELEREAAAGRTWQDLLRERLLDGHHFGRRSLIPVGQEIGFAAELARRHGTVSGILRAFQDAWDGSPALADEQRILAPESESATAMGVRYPILQGPMTRVTDVADFAEAVGENGAVPFLALAFLRRPAVGQLLAETARRLGSAPWGVGMLGYAPEALRREQWDACAKTRPNYAIVNGERLDMARRFESLGIPPFLYVSSGGLLAARLRDGMRRFVVRGSEGGGPAGPCTSFVLWQSMADVLLAAEIDDPAAVHVVLAGGIHDALSAAMAAVIAAPLAARGMKIGVLMGTAYLLTAEATRSGAILEEYQRRAIACRETAVLACGDGFVVRCTDGPLVSSFEEKKRQLILSGKSPEEIKCELESFNVGRLWIASKGFVRSPYRRARDSGDGHVSVSEAEQCRSGLYMVGEAAAIEKQARPMAELHEAVSNGSSQLLARFAEQPASKPGSRRSTQKRRSPVAIVGMGCLFPQSPDARRFWQNILLGLHAVREVPPERWRPEDFFHGDRLHPDHTYSKWGAFLEEITFDPLRYRMPPATIPSIEPIQLMALEVARQALEDAGYERPGFPRRKTAVVFAAAGTHDLGLGYAFRTALRHWLPEVEGLDEATRHEILESLEHKLPEWTEDSFAGFLLNVVAGRIANRFDLTGSNFTVDAACASALAALQTAYEQLSGGVCDAALVGAVDGTNNPFCFLSFAKTQAMSPTGVCRPFDKKADGLTLGEGVAAIVLKRLADAERNGDKIYAVIKGLGGSGDGPARSMMAPFPKGQQLAVERALEAAGVAAGSISLVEAHGTGTPVGDGVEVRSLGELYVRSGAQPGQSAIGSVKSMIGHTKSVAGLAGLIKATLALKHKILPPTIGVDDPHEAFTEEDCPFYVCTEPRPWFHGGRHPRRAAVSAFGFGGTNFHVVLEEYCGDYHSGAEIDFTPRAAEVFTWTASRREELLESLAKFDGELAGLEPGGLAQLACSVCMDESRQEAEGRASRKCRLSLVATSMDDLREKIHLALDAVPAGKTFDHPAGLYYSESPPVVGEQVCFLFPGQGSQSVNMLRELVLYSPWSRELFEKADKQLARFFEQPLSRYIYPIPAFSEEERRRQQEVLDDTRLAQPAMGLVELFACELLRRFGIRPGTVAGHSYGECVALCVAGVYSAEDLLEMSALRGQAVHKTCGKTPGGMASVFADAETTRAALAELKIGARLANLNADVQTVIAGPVDQITRAVKKLPDKGLRVRETPVTAAFHTPALNEVRRIMDGHMARMKFGRPKLRVYSNTTAAPYPTTGPKIRKRLGEQTTEPVQFAPLLERAYRDGVRVFIEVGPGTVLTSLVRRNLKDKEFSALSMDSSKRNGWKRLGHLLAKATALGLPVALEPWFEHRRLTHCTTAEAPRRRAKAEPRPTDWRVSPAGSRPCKPAGPRPQPSSPRKEEGTGQPPPEDSATVAPAVESRLGAIAAPAPRPAGSLPPSATPSPRRVVAQGSNLQASTGRYAAKDVARQHVRESTAMEKATVKGTEVSTPEGNGLANANLLGQFQSAMVQWLEVQKAQQQVNQRFLEMQERVMLACLRPEAQQPPDKPSVSQAASGIAAAVPPALPPLKVRPAAVVPADPSTVAQAASVSAPSAAGTPEAADLPFADRPAPAEIPLDPGPAVEPHSSPPPKSRPAALPQALPAEPPPEVASDESSSSLPARPTPLPAAAEHVASEDGPPRVEVFREDLLQAIADRTGYPIEMLDEQLDLEAGLGIDSIKTIEIFGMLSQYHAYLPGASEDQEESLAAFAQMRTIGDILTAYSENSTREREEQQNVESEREEVGGDGDGDGDARPPLERARPEAALAPRSGEKKKSSPLRTSS